MALINWIQQTVLYLVVTGFLGFGLWKFSQWAKKEKLFEVLKGKMSSNKSNENYSEPKETETRFYSPDELKKMKGGFY